MSTSDRTLVNMVNLFPYLSDYLHASGDKFIHMQRHLIFARGLINWLK
jgi:hypothetical protein